MYDIAESWEAQATEAKQRDFVAESWVAQATEAKQGMSRNMPFDSGFVGHVWLKNTKLARGTTFFDIINFFKTAQGYGKDIVCGKIRHNKDVVLHD